MEKGKTEYVVANLEKAPRIWNIYNTQELAEAARTKADKYYMETDTLTTQCIVLSLEDYEKAHEAYWLGLPIREIRSEDFLEMLYCLPPLKWESNEDWESFIMQEFTSHNITSQYIR